MPGFLLNAGSTVLCVHAGIARPANTSPRVIAGGQPVVVQTTPYLIARCSFYIAGAPSPCVTATWVKAASRITAGGVPVLLRDSQAVCMPNGTPVVIINTQMRVSGM